MQPCDFFCMMLFNSKGRFEWDLHYTEPTTRHGRTRKDMGERPDQTKCRWCVRIKASQGHSFSGFDPSDLYTTSLKVSDVEALEPIIHGTYADLWDNNIRDAGLIPGGQAQGSTRMAVHFLAVGSAVKKSQNSGVSALRESADTFIFFNLKQWLTDGHEAYMTSNCVVNVHELASPEYFFTKLTRRPRTWTTEMWFTYWKNNLKPFGGKQPTAPGRYNSAEAEEPVPTTPLPETPPATAAGEPAYANGGALDVSPYTGVFDIYGDEIP